MTAPRLGMGMPADESWIPRRLDDLQRQLNELRAARTLEAATIGAGGLTVDGGVLTVSGGKLVITGNGVAESSDYQAGQAGWALQPNGNAEFNDLTLRGGIIGDAALANPASFGVVAQDWDTLTFTTTNLEKTTSIAVPAGYSRALVSATAVAGCTASASPATLYVSCSIQGSAPEYVAQQLSANYAGSVSRGYAASLTGLTGGGTVTVGAFGSIDVNGSVVAGSCNLHVNAAVIFLR